MPKADRDHSDIHDANEHLRIALNNYTAHTVQALNIDTYAQIVYQTNRAAGL